MCRGSAGKPYATGIKPCATARAEAGATGTEAAALASSQSHTLHGASLVQDLGLRGVFSTNHFPFSFFSLLFLLIQSLESITRKNEMATGQPRRAWHPAGLPQTQVPEHPAAICLNPMCSAPNTHLSPCSASFFCFQLFFFFTFHKNQQMDQGPGLFQRRGQKPQAGSALQRNNPSTSGEHPPKKCRRGGQPPASSSPAKERGWREKPPCLSAPRMR